MLLISNECYSAELLSRQSKRSELLINCFSIKGKRAFQKSICHNTDKMAALKWEEKSQILNCNILKTGRRWKFKFSENAFLLIQHLGQE